MIQSTNFLRMSLSATSPSTDFRMNVRSESLVIARISHGAYSETRLSAQIRPRTILHPSQQLALSLSHHYPSVTSTTIRLQCPCAFPREKRRCKCDFVDPIVADHSSDHSNEIITEYNARPDYLTAILKHKFGLKGHLGYLHIAQIDPQGKHILVLYHPPPSGDEVEFKIPLDPPVKTLFEIRPRMHEWRYAAFQHFQVVSLSIQSTLRDLVHSS